MEDLDDIIATERLRLRLPRRSDAARITEFIGDWDVARMLARVPYPYAIEHAHAWLDTISQETRTHDVFIRAIDQGGLVGAIGLSDIREIEGGKIAELGYWLAKPYWGKGLMTEAGRAFLRHTFETLGFAGLKSGHLKENFRSGRVLAKLGFRYAGEGVKECVARGAEVPHVDVVLTRAGWREHMARRAA